MPPVFSVFVAEVEELVLAAVGLDDNSAGEEGYDGGTSCSSSGFLVRTAPGHPPQSIENMEM